MPAIRPHTQKPANRRKDLLDEQSSATQARVTFDDPTFCFANSEFFSVLLAERHDFDTYIRYLTERGEFGETDPETQIKRLRDRIGDHYSFERTRPDGTVIEVRHNPMPDGGIALIYSDITERKRSEAEFAPLATPPKQPTAT